MHVCFERSGGFAGMRLSTTIESDSLTHDDQQRLADMVAASDFFHLPPHITAPSPGPDRLHYTITIESEDKRHTVVVDEQVVPATLRPLIKWLTGRLFDVT
ncbi:MAG: protealysin inhibitor emfourin [Halobacteriota archaeon]